MAKKQTSSSDKNREFLDTVMKKLDKGMKAYRHNLDQSKEDLEFLNGDQWEKDERDRRKRRKRPMLTINMLPEKVDKVVGDMRQNRARVKLRPASSDADSEIAKIREGMIRKIEYNSDAPNIYDYAGGRMVECGEGTWRVLTRWCEDNPFVQEIYLKLIKNSFMVIFDPDSTSPNKEDAKWCFILSKMGKDEFEETYPGKRLPTSAIEFGQGMGKEHWYDSETVTVAEFITLKMVKKTMVLMDDGDVLEKEKAQERIKEWEKEWEVKLEKGNEVPSDVPQMPTMMNPTTPMSPMAATPPQQPMAPASGASGMGVLPPTPNANPMMPQQAQQSVVIGGPKPGAPPKPVILKEKETDSREIYHYTVTACDVLNGPTKIPGKYIPVIKVTGKERNIEGKDYIRGLIRNGKDPQKLVNYWNTSAAETVALAPKAPWLGTAKQFEGYENDYAAANIENFPFLKYNVDPDASGPPQRSRPQEPPVAIFTQISIAERNLNTVVGMGPDMRDVAPDASAQSLIQRQKPAELSTFSFVDNLAKAQLWTYKIINEMIPEVYDTERDVPVRREDDTETYVPINMRAEDAVKAIEINPDRYRGMNASKLRKELLNKGTNARFNDIGVGRYDIVIDIGPSFATQRAEASDKFIMLAQTNPKIWGVAGDLIVEGLDVVGSDKLADRLKKTLPPGMIKPKPGEPPMQMPPSPQARLVMSKVQTEQIKQKKEMLKVQVELVKQKTELIRQYNEAREGDNEIRGKILQVLSELHSPNHPADESLGGIMGMTPQGEGEGTEA